MKPVIGIDLGTTFSCVGVWQDNRVVILDGDTTQRTTPSYVAFTERQIEPLVGYGAKNYARVDPEATLFDAKRMIGRPFSDPAIQQDMKLWPFKVVDMDGRPYLQVRQNGTTKSFAPEEVSTYVLKKMRSFAERRLDCEVRDAVITCPAYFNNSQREATRRAGVSAGLNVLRVINEPTAAAIAYALDLKSRLSGRRKNVVVFDFGGGTFDVSLVTIDGEEFRAVSVDGDTHLGGEDLNDILVEHFAKLFKRETGKDIMRDAESTDPKVKARAKKALYRLRSSCEAAKIELSSCFEADVEVTYAGENYLETITREQFEELCMSTFRRCISILERLLRNAGKSKSDIDDVVLVGGSTRIPCVRKMVSAFFGGKELKHSVHVDEAVAYGATIQAAILTKQVRYVVGDVTPRTLSTDLASGKVSVLIPRGTSLPCKRSETYTTATDNQTGVHVGVYEGEEQMCVDNNKLGEFTLSGISPAPAGVPKVEVTFEIDFDGILHVSARDRASGSRDQIEITRTAS
jgi:L1 cell adhesion molecule like protein